ncbi:cytochrome C oxidase subunit III [Hahella sp. CCB-MM4]|nr:cytochrome C oxidase subunit III [Hahella sp. CCB-MM4]
MRTLDLGEPGGWSSPDPAGGLLWRFQATKVAVRILLAVVTSLFMLFVVTFIGRSQFSDWQSLTGPLGPLGNTSALWVNTAFLVLASISIQVARMASRKHLRSTVAAATVIAGMMAAAFIVGQAILWGRLAEFGFTVSVNPAISFFYLLTGLHAIHIAGGLIAWMRSMERVWQRQAMPVVNAGLELCAIYWHYLLFVWLVLFALLTSKPETYAAIAALCGLR